MFCCFCSIWNSIYSVPTSSVLAAPSFGLLRSVMDPLRACMGAWLEAVGCLLCSWCPYHMHGCSCSRSAETRSDSIITITTQIYYHSTAGQASFTKFWLQGTSVIRVLMQLMRSGVRAVTSVVTDAFLEFWQQGCICSIPITPFLFSVAVIVTSHACMGYGATKHWCVFCHSWSAACHAQLKH
jgi:hypothetical protein